ncbi:agc ndr ndr kinase [Fusarium pseudocircinatum]|uniref:non-specific serine/threonine protein kinase n=1 Tax=Fusarium pseudocircinatum TaxID=56676 RepID=A0A8H5L207_9HYPO|nr:agc ndr ndr kinase [Fusarium pseudocircinatum]
MAPTLLKKASQQFVRLSSCDSKNIFEASPGSDLNVADGAEAQTSRKFRTGGSKRWTPFRGAFKSMRKNARSRAEVSKDAHEFPEDQARPHLLFRSVPRQERGTRSPDAKEVVIRKLGLHPTAMASNSTLVIRNSPKRARSFLQLVNPTPSSGLITPPSSEASDTATTTDDRSTAKTSMESSMLSNWEIMDRRYNRRNPWTRSSPEGRALSTIPEAGVVQARPTIATVERASAAKIFLETYFNELLYKPNARALRGQCLESQLCNYLLMTPEEKEKIRVQYRRQETCHLRESRAMRAGSLAYHGNQDSSPLVNNYEPLQILGKGSFGVVRLVREKPAPGHAFPGQVYAMKVIRKTEMLRNSQEGHLRAERDFLVASEGSQWAVPLIASFQDTTNLYLVMEYMPGGDFLGLLIRQNILQEPVAQFYIAEMILAVEEAHRLNFIHRDIKPDNFLISATGHLKISDFGLAFNDHWSHDAAYYNTHRYSLVRRLNMNINGDETDQKGSKDLLKHLEWYQSLVSGLDRHGKHPLASNEDLRSLIGWRNRHGNRTAARSVVGTSQYMAPEVVLKEGRKQTKQNIVVRLQEELQVSTQAIQKDIRLCSRRYQVKYRDSFKSYVFPDDAEDIKAHRWFRNTPWDRLQSMPPPFTPNLKSDDDAHYFDESEPFEDWSESIPSGVFLRSEDVKEILFGFDTHVQAKAMELIKIPFDAAKLRSIDRDIDGSKELQPNDKATLKQFIRFYGHKERKRPRDMLLRDKDTKKTSLRIRKETAFMGYTWRRMRPGGYIDPKVTEMSKMDESQASTLNTER